MAAAAPSMTAAPEPRAVPSKTPAPHARAAPSTTSAPGARAAPTPMSTTDARAAPRMASVSSARPASPGPWGAQPGTGGSPGSPGPAPSGSTAPLGGGSAPVETEVGDDDAMHDDAVGPHMVEPTKAETACAVPALSRQKRRGSHRGGGVSGRVPQFATLSAELRASYEAFNDWQTALPITKPRKNCQPGRFNSYRLRALQRFALT
ncbi:hypothetical protein I4F81_004219 [Pyropia yezoensis]|uniref:Uncharacterized protein n=1 Tax=Pyropia yezoensis TaxID=2788 RepID=A0ACC3BUR0_PYRYE|nr:hypothetical protein I4F81_004219 [Neopyropia yezoensis]